MDQENASMQLETLRFVRIPPLIEFRKVIDLPSREAVDPAKPGLLSIGLKVTVVGLASGDAIEDGLAEGRRPGFVEQTTEST